VRRTLSKHNLAVHLVANCRHLAPVGLDMLGTRLHALDGLANLFEGLDSLCRDRLKRGEVCATGADGLCDPRLNLVKNDSATLPMLATETRQPISKFKIFTSPVCGLNFQTRRRRVRHATACAEHN
jgi:hypothetical protein